MGHSNTSIAFSSDPELVVPVPWIQIEEFLQEDVTVICSSHIPSGVIGYIVRLGEPNAANEMKKVIVVPSRRFQEDHVGNSILNNQMQLDNRIPSCRDQYLESVHLQMA
jgi:hypothetical protein